MYTAFITIITIDAGLNQGCIKSLSELHQESIFQAALV